MHGLTQYMYWIMHHVRLYIAVLDQLMEDLQVLGISEDEAINDFLNPLRGIICLGVVSSVGVLSSYTALS